MKSLRHSILAATIVTTALASEGIAARKIAAAPDRDNEAISAPDREPLPGSVTGGAKFSESLSSGWADVLMPFARSGGLNIFGNFRGTWDDNSQSLYSAGVAIRYLIPNREIILGTNAYYDSLDSQTKNHFDQFGFGFELLTRWFDARFNYYQPDDYVHRSNLIPGIFRYESGLEGWNLEAGFLVPWLDRYAETRILGGYYRYASDSRVGVQYEGWKARGEVRWTPGIITDIEYWADKKLNGGNWVAGIRVSLPFDFANLAKGRNPFAGASDAFKFGRRREFKERLGETVLRSHRVQTATSGLYGDLEYFGATTLDGSRIMRLGTGAAPVEAVIRDANGAVVGAIFGLTRSSTGALMLGGTAAQNNAGGLPSVALSAVNGRASSSYTIDELRGGVSRSAIILNVKGQDTLTGGTSSVTQSGIVAVFRDFPNTSSGGGLAVGNYTGSALPGPSTGLIVGSGRMLFLDSNAFTGNFGAPYVIRGEPVPPFQFR